jgi:hypothetical protein
LNINHGGGNRSLPILRKNKPGDTASFFHREIDSGYSFCRIDSNLIGGVVLIAMIIVLSDVPFHLTGNLKTAERNAGNQISSIILAVTLPGDEGTSNIAGYDDRGFGKGSDIIGLINMAGDGTGSGDGSSCGRGGSGGGNGNGGRRRRRSCQAAERYY